MKQVISEQNQNLVKPITSEEVKCAAFSMHPDKSPGQDGLNPKFFQAYWSVGGGGDKQSAFVEGRPLTDNTLIAFELNHYIRRKTQGVNGVVGLKIDVSKAYDRLE